MRTTTHNAFKIKRKLSRDYRRDGMCTIKHPATGLDIKISTEVVKILRERKMI